MTIKTVAVFGSSGISQESEGAKSARKLGELLTKAGLAVLNGGYMGAMEAVSQGAHEAGGYVIGITCREFTDRTPNPYLNEYIWTDNLPQRISTLMINADAYVVLDGNIGTIAELLLAWNMKAMGGTKPVIVVGEKLKQCVHDLTKHTEISDQQLLFLDFVPDIEHVPEVLRNYTS